MAYSLKDVSKTYDGKMVLKIDELEISEGKIMGLVGPSGAGKSTLLRLLNFIESADTGEIIFLGKSYSKEKLPGLLERRKVTTVFQRPYLLTASVLQNIIYPLKIRKQQFSFREIEEIISQLGLSDLKHQRADKLSGGEAQRVSLARSLVFEPQVLLLDEPTSNLDPANIKIIEDMIKTYNEKTDATIVMVTHNIFQAKRLADQVCLLYRGELVEMCSKDKFFNSPEQETTKQFLSGELVY